MCVIDSVLPKGDNFDNDQNSLRANAFQCALQYGCAIAEAVLEKCPAWKLP